MSQLFEDYPSILVQLPVFFDEINQDLPSRNARRQVPEQPQMASESAKPTAKQPEKASNRNQKAAKQAEIDQSANQKASICDAEDGILRPTSAE